MASREMEPTQPTHSPTYHFLLTNIHSFLIAGVRPALCLIDDTASLWWVPQIFQGLSSGCLLILR